MKFDYVVLPSALSIQFQGGFSAKTVEVHLSCDSDVNTSVIHPEDNNSVQKFTLNGHQSSLVKLVFKDLTDFFGRIIIYKLDILGMHSS